LLKVLTKNIESFLKGIGSHHVLSNLVKNLLLEATRSAELYGAVEEMRKFLIFANLETELRAERHTK